MDENEQKALEEQAAFEVIDELNQSRPSEYEVLANAFQRAPSGRATAATPEQAAAYEGADFVQPPMAEQTPEQRFAEAVNLFRQPRAPLAPTGSISQDAIGADMQAQLEANSPQLTTEGSNLLMAQEAPEAFNVMQGALAGTGLQANMPVPLAPAVAPQQLQPIAPEIQLAQQAEAQKQAQVEAVKQQASAQKQQAQLQHQHNIETAATARVEEKNAAQSGRDWGKIIGQAIAVGLGEYGRYLTGGKENVALKTLERLADSEAMQKKLNLEEKLAMQNQILQQAQLKLKQEESKTDNELKRAQIGKIRAEMGQAQEQVQAQQRMAALAASGAGLSAQDVQSLPESDRTRAMLLPNGTYGLAVSPIRAKEATDTIDMATNAIRDLRKLQDFSNYFGNNSLKKAFDRESVAQAQALQQAIKGNLRLPILGPGAMTDNEQRLLDKVVRDPSAIFSLNSANKASLDQLVQKLQEGRRQTIKSAGVVLPPSANDINISKLKAANPKLTDRTAADILMNSGHWIDE